MSWPWVRGRAAARIFQACSGRCARELNCPYVLCEGGGKLGLALLEAGFVDEFLLHLSPLILGDNDAHPLFSGRAPLDLGEALRLRVSGTRLCGGDVHINLRPAAPAAGD